MVLSILLTTVCAFAKRMEYRFYHRDYYTPTSPSTTTDCTCCPLKRNGNHVRYNSAFRLCYSLQLLPCYNEKHQLITVFPRPHSPQCKMRKQTTPQHNNNSNHHHHHHHPHLQHRPQHQQQQQNNHHDYSNNNCDGDTIIDENNPTTTTNTHTTTNTTTNTTTTSTNGDNSNDLYSDVINDRRVGGGGIGSKQEPPQPSYQVYSIWWLPVVIAAAILVLYAIYASFRDAVGNSHLVKFPYSIEDIRDMTDFLSSAKKEHPVHLLVLFSAAYVFKQSFAVPGSVFLNLLAGALFGPYVGFVLTCSLTAVGATCCFLLSRTFGMAHVVRFFPDRVRFFQEKVESNKNGLLFFLLFLRLFPMTPNWAINMICPIVGVPVHLFFLSVFIGLMPYNFICVQTGDVLSQISSVNDVLDAWTMAKMAAVALVALVPGLAINYLKINKQD